MPLIDRRWLPLNALRAFEAVGRQLSFTGGAALLPVVRIAFDRMEAVMNGILREEAGHQRRLRVHMPPSFLQQVALPILGDFRREFPDIIVDVSSSFGTGLPPTEVDVAVVYDRPQAGDTVRDLLWLVRVTPVCAPSVAAKSAGLDLPAFLEAQELLHVKLQGEPIGAHWSHFARQRGFALNTQRGMAFDTVTVAAQYAMAGQGVVLADIDMFAEQIAQGRLTAPYETVIEDGFGYYLAFHSEDLGDPAISLFRSWMIARLGRAMRKQA
jgi:LysR family glycine cleavage system transcriptional activator